MASSAERVTTARFYAPDAAVVRDASVPWYLYAVALAATSVVVGVIWDISWHITIGRDTFWTPAHLCTYLAGAIVGGTCGYVALRTTFAGTEEERERAMRFWGFRAPLGAWICVWGSFAMLTSAPFDDWWHNAYGLDVKIISPPHALLALGMTAIVVGAMVWALAWQNRAPAAARPRYERLFIYDAGLLLGIAAVFVTEYSQRVLQHSTLFLRVAAMTYPLFLVAAARGSTMRWPATTASLVYMAVRIVMGWILPLWSAAPKLGPIYNPVDHMVAMEFPLLLVVPGLAIDLVMQRVGKEGRGARDWMLAPVLGALFVAMLAAAQWPFANFLNSPAARNWVFFADRNFPYSLPPTTSYFNYRFAHLPADAAPGGVARNALLAVVFAALSARAGLAWGGWMRRVQR